MSKKELLLLSEVMSLLPFVEGLLASTLAYKVYLKANPTELDVRL